MDKRFFSMFTSFFSGSNALVKSDEQFSKRRHPRRSGDKCVVYIQGKPHPVENWSMGGLLVHADSRNFGVGTEEDVIVKFQTRNRLVDIPHRARVVRKNNDNVAFEFLPLSQHTRRTFQNVISDFVTGQFLDSQSA